jgi:hypothetical protein
MEYSGSPVCGQHQSVDDHVTHHLRFIAEAARQQCDLLVFPELSLTGSGRRRYLPTRRRPAGTAARRGASLPDYRYCRAPVERMVSARKARALYPRSSTHPALSARWRSQPGAGDKQLTIIDAHADSPNLDPRASLFTSCQSVGITAGGSPSVPCSASRINMPLRC